MAENMAGSKFPGDSFQPFMKVAAQINPIHFLMLKDVQDYLYCFELCSSLWFGRVRF